MRYKAGQLITIEHKVYRVKNRIKNGLWCTNCALYKEDCDTIFLHCFEKIGIGYLEEIKPKTKNAKRRM